MEPEDIFPKIIKLKKLREKYKLSELQFNRKHGYVGIYRLTEKSETNPNYLVLTLEQARAYELKGKKT